MRARFQSNPASHDRASFEQSSYQTGRASPHSHAERHHAASSARPALPHSENDDPSPRTHAARPFTTQQHRDHRQGHRAAAEGARRLRTAHAPQHDQAKAQQERRFTLSLSLLGHKIRLGPVVFWIVVGTLVIMASWSVVTATYFAFRDDFITRAISRQADMQAAYEDRLADMRAQVDRVTTRQLLEQQQFEQKLEQQGQVEQKLDQVLKRQSVIEQRSKALGSLGDPAVTGSIRAPVPKPSRMHDSGNRQVPADRNAANGAFIGLDGRLTRMMTSLDRIELRQANALIAMHEKYETKANRIRTVLSEAGITAGRRTDSGTGGPFIPAKLTGDPAAFERQVHRISLARTYLDRLSKTLVGIPLRQPVSGVPNLSSGFGVRTDPFNGRPAMHTGLDFRGDAGEPIRATANGRVVSAGWSGGYGRLVEINHGNGLSTRYGHLSRIQVHPGQLVRAGQVVGRMGSTGRSTGPHLHYETRIRGEAVNPQRFLRAGQRLGL